MMSAIEKALAGPCAVCQSLLIHNPINTPEGEYDWVVHRIMVHGDLDFARYYLRDDWLWKERTKQVKERSGDHELVTMMAAIMVLES